MIPATIITAPVQNAQTDVVMYLHDAPANHLPIAFAVLACMAWRFMRWLKLERT